MNGSRLTVKLPLLPRLAVLGLLALTASGWSVAAGGAASSPAPTLGDALFPGLGQLGLDVQHYDVALSVDRPGTAELRGVVTLTLGSTRLLPTIRLDFTGPEVGAVRWNGQPVPFVVEAGAQKLTVTPPASLRPGETARLTVEYGGRAGTVTDPDLGLDLGWEGVLEAGTNYTLSEPHGAHSFLPSNDHPADTATFTTRLTVPAGFTAAASGVEDLIAEGAEARAGRHTFVFHQARPIPTYALGLHIGHLERVESPAVPVGPGGAPVVRRDYFPMGTPDRVRAAYRRTDEMLRALSGWFGPYPFAAYGVAVLPPQVDVPALETATLSTMPVESSNEQVALHELAHQWFGNAVPLRRWADVWLNEGFATYAELLWTEAQGGDGPAMVRRWYARLQSRGTRPLVAATQEELFDSTAYQRGALTLHALRLAVGDAAFRDFLHTYTARFSGGSSSNNAVDTADFLALVRERVGAAGEAAVRPWVFDVGLPPLPVGEK
ncbi:M1 family metallopeptidase [Deinococcus hopiensis]|uniref:Aminopeptidase N n=1 Tax=Deinococcus hopiensis KR-140 TaxID=695939 RepID=A0A1W1VNE1_9DEIO|nr:M1 family metallopeptidase [Deinococcus hopiensis]SMB94838.1 Aminopeptidase N [Deinococcus hopiensis KR-140]